jgi:hypothetical protein
LRTQDEEKALKASKEKNNPEYIKKLKNQIVSEFSPATGS